MKLLRTFALLCSAVALLAVAPAINTAAAPAKKDAAKTAVIDINTATAEQLQTLDGIGEAISAKIIAARPFTNKSQLVSKKIVTQKVYDDIKDKIVAKQPGGDKAKSDKKGGDKKKKKTSEE